MTRHPTAQKLIDKHPILEGFYDGGLFSLNYVVLEQVLRAEEQAVIDRVGESAVAQPGTLTVGMDVPTVGT